MYFLEDDRIGLRRLEETDIEGPYAEWLNDEQVCRFNSHHRFPVSASELAEYIRGVNAGSREMVFAVIEKNSKEHIGNISLQQINMTDRSAEIAFLFGNKAYWGNGYATDAGKLLIGHAFDALGIHRIYFGTSEDNIAMQRVGEHLGFSKVGVRREALYKRGSYRDIVDYDLLETEWRAK